MEIDAATYSALIERVNTLERMVDMYVDENNRLKEEIALRDERIAIISADLKREEDDLK